MNLFYGNPNRSFYVREITRKIDEQINSVRRELANLLSIGIISSDNTNNRLYYEVSQTYEYYEPLSAIFGGTKPAVTKKGVKTPATSAKEQDLKVLGNVDLALYTGQFTRDEASGIDVLIVGDVNQTKMSKFITELEAKEGKELRYTVMTPADFSYRVQVKDRFLSNILSAKKQVLLDKKGLLTEPASEE